MPINPTPPVSCKYGAPMGRHAGPANAQGKSQRYNLVRVPLDSGGYDRGGAYWGVGAPLWYATNDERSEYFRARTRDAAKEYVREHVDVDATFYR